MLIGSTSKRQCSDECGSHAKGGMTGPDFSYYYCINYDRKVPLILKCP